VASKKRKGVLRRPPSRRALATSGDRYVVASYEITSEPLSSEHSGCEVPPELDPHIERLFHLTLSHPRDAIAELERFIERYPDCPKLFNFLGNACISIGDFDRASQITEESYKRFPNYLFAKLTYADLCVCRGDLDEIPVIFDGKYDLSLLCPNRKRFHITEAVGFMGVMGYYFMRQGEVERARPYYKILKSLAPDEPQTQRLEELMQLPVVQNPIAAWLASRLA
jgi:tetratricopeptide (TPR) repeat protein